MRGLAVIACVVLATFALPVRAQPAAERPRVVATLEYTRDEAASRCPSDAELRDAVSRELGYPVFERTPATRAVRVHIERIKLLGRDALRARVSLRDEQGAMLGERVIESAGADCVELASALTLAIGLALDPSYLMAKGSAAPCPAPAPCPVCPPRQATDTEVAAPPAEDEAASSWRGFRAGAGLALGVAALPATSGGGVIHAAATWTGASLALEAVLHPGARGGELPASGASEPIEAELLRGQLVLCGQLPVARAWTFDACGLGAFGALRGRAQATGKQDASLAASAGARACATVLLGELLFAQVRLDAHANIVRTTLRVGGQPAWTSARFWGELSALLGVRL